MQIYQHLALANYNETTFNPKQKKRMKNNNNARNILQYKGSLQWKNGARG